MSVEHVALMNALVAVSAAVAVASRGLPSEFVLAHKLQDEDSGAVVWWQLRFSPKNGVAFALGKPSAPANLTLVGDYWDMIQAVQAQRMGGSHIPSLLVEGDASVMQVIAPVLSLVQAVATVPVAFALRSSPVKTLADPT